MENKKRSLRLALLLALASFAAIVFVASRDHKFQGGDMSAVLSFGLDLELKWIATDANADFAVVQDTLAFYAEALHEKGGVLSSQYQIDHCCEDAALQASYTGGARFYHLDLSANFASEAGRAALMAFLFDHGMAQSKLAKADLGTIRGNADFVLPLPSRPGEVLRVQGSQFQLTLVPRPVNALMEAPIV